MAILSPLNQHACFSQSVNNADFIHSLDALEPDEELPFYCCIQDLDLEVLEAKPSCPSTVSKII